MDQTDLTIYLVVLVVLVVAFVGIVAWAFGRKRKARFERDAKMPFQDKDG
jgi:cytochrome c oxidase cbb3-type subunit IV